MTGGGAFDGLRQRRSEFFSALLEGECDTGLMESLTWNLRYGTRMSFPKKSSLSRTR